MSTEAFSGKVFLLITGASRGIGRQIAITFGSLLEEGSRMLLLARDKNALEEVAKIIPPKIKVCTINADLCKATKTDFERFISECLCGTPCNAFDQLIVMHNVGSLGNITHTTNKMLDIDTWRQHYDLNLFIPAILNAVIMNIFDDKTIKKTIINITSLFGIQAIKGFAYYCTVKAAREMYFKVFALENPNVNMLSYSPGPVDTNMFNFLCEFAVDPETKKRFLDEKQKIMLTPEQTVNRLVHILEKHKYKSGDRISYYDNM
ncbi:sepiapterin reductase-like [Pogonomyrmex barbatus]|uniref:Sepiapterin reductase-like n=1 Tax=Pogonomyrmex barbatus TaxID=144034 RepID=A0A6I9WJ26_9HYME|nr:sepiapterin reductase-like [Pogonomyrmex barbatus]XP_025074993.1 sepiapterin reductase-like [Pogonomyrmex barbatus]XP_025074994.1 sepiapterin reductase-like [Pogonomyrmex barbatus]